ASPPCARNRRGSPMCSRFYLVSQMKVTGVEAATCSFAYRGRHSNSENSIVVDFILAAAAQVPGLEWHRGTEGGYPDIEMPGPALGDSFWAVDIKVARRRPLR